MACLHCGGPKFRSSYKYCSNDCQQGFQWNALREDMERAGKILTVNGSGNGYKVGRRFLLEKQGHCCAMCKRRTWNGEPIPLVLDHIDGNSTNWKIKNLRLICPNCDAQTPTYKGRNRGNGRHTRRLRYAAGKSF